MLAAREYSNTDKNRVKLNKVLLVLTLALASETSACRDAIQEVVNQSEAAPEIDYPTPLSRPEGPSIRTGQLIHDIERQFPQFRQLVERRLAEMDRRGLPHVDRASLLAPFEQVTANQQNRFRNVEQVKRDGLNLADTEAHLPNHQFFYGLLPTSLVNSGVVFASYDPMTDQVNLPEKFQCAGNYTPDRFLP